MTSRYLIGADGVYSRVRRQLHRGKRMDVLPVIQEHWKIEGDLGNCFYVIFRGDISSTYAYIIPKDYTSVFGVGVAKAHSSSISASIHRFKNWLLEEFDFKLLSLKRSETWAIPHGSVFEGKGNVILVGDAAGFCNPFSGEGIRLAIESGVSAGSAIQEALSSDTTLASTYSDHTEWINRLVLTMREIVINFTEEDMEEFVKSELSRRGFGPSSHS